MRLPLITYFVLVTSMSWSQTSTSDFEKYPVFPQCTENSLTSLPQCFQKTLVDLVLADFEIPSKLVDQEYQGEMVLFFEVTSEGVFQLLHTEAVYKELKESAQAFFTRLPKIAPATYGGEPTFMQFTMPIQLPLSRNKNTIVSSETSRINQMERPSSPVGLKPMDNALKKEYEAISARSLDLSRKYNSGLNIPFSHQVYSRFDQQMNLIGTNSHTASKPYSYAQVNAYYDLENWHQELTLDKSSWFGRKFFNEHMVSIQGEDYWFTIDPGADLQLGLETDDRREESFTYNNTRTLFAQGGLGKRLSFYVGVFESQGRFATYYNEYARSIRPAGGNPAIIPGRGIAKEGRGGDFDYPVTEGYINVAINKFFNVQFGTGKNFIGDGYRSLLLSDNASPYTYLKLNTRFWKFDYTNIWSSMRDVRPEVTESGTYRTKYLASHYLSFNASKRFTLGLFESVIWENDNGQGFDVNYLNPLIFYHTAEFASGSRGGNVVVGTTAKYKFTDQIYAYGQLVIDELAFGDLLGGNQSFRNKQGFQLGAKYFNAFGIRNLTLQAEYNQIRPYVYSNNEIQLNYGHTNQPLAHPLGANFKEFIGIARYEYGRYYASGKVIYHRQGLEIGDIDEVYYGGSIYGNDENRPSDNGIAFFQGNEADMLYVEGELGYLLNPATNLKVYLNPILRQYRVDVANKGDISTSTLWVNLGFRTDLFNWYYDY